MVVILCSAVLILVTPLFLPTATEISLESLGGQETTPYLTNDIKTPIQQLPLQTAQGSSHQLSLHNIDLLSDPIFNDPPNPPYIEGPTSGETRTIYLFNITVTDPDENSLTLLEVDFGDGSELFQECGCNGPWPSGKIIKVEHQWKKQGTFIIKARVQDGYGLWSDWGTLDISLTRSTFLHPRGMLDITLHLLTYLFSQKIKPLANLY
jgi:hypothetical protein